MEIIIAQIIGFVGVGLAILGAWLISQKKRTAWLVWIPSNLLIITASFIQLNWWGLVLGISYMLITINGLKNYYGRKKNGLRNV